MTQYLQQFLLILYSLYAQILLRFCYNWNIWTAGNCRYIAVQYDQLLHTAQLRQNTPSVTLYAKKP